MKTVLSLFVVFASAAAAAETTCYTNLSDIVCVNDAASEAAEGTGNVAAAGLGQIQGAFKWERTNRKSLITEVDIGTRKDNGCSGYMEIVNDVLKFSELEGECRLENGSYIEIKE